MLSVCWAPPVVRTVKAADAGELVIPSQYSREASSR
jgi:hypothetical protein